MTMHKMIDGVSIQLTPEEEAAELARWAANDLIAVRDGIVSQIVGLEAQITSRRLREAILNPGAQAWLADKEAKIAALRSQLS